MQELNNKWEIKTSYLTLWLAVAVFFTAMQIQHSLSHGRLSLPPTYDDISYFNDALKRLQIFQNDGLGGVFKDYLERPPHSPLSTLMSFLGFAIFGIQDWAPSAINFILVFFCLIFLDYLTRKLTLNWKITIVFISLTCPLMGHLIIQCRPDIFCGLLTASVVILIAEEPWFSITKKRSITIGILFGIALLAKPSIFPVTVILIISAIIINIIIDIVIYQHKFTSAASVLLVVGLAIFIASFYYLFALPQIVKYIYETETNLDIWGLKLPLVENISYYLTGQGGVMMIGNWLFLWLSLALISLICLIYKKEWSNIIRVSPLVGTVLIAYAIITISEHKTPYTGVVFACFLMFTSLQMLVYLLEFCSIFALKSLRFGLYSILLISIFLFKWPAYSDVVYPNIKSFSPSQKHYYYELVSAVYEDINQDMKQRLSKSEQDSKRVYFTSTSHWFNPDSLIYYQAKKMGNLKIIAADGITEDNLSLQEKLMQESDYILAFSIANPDSINWAPSFKIQGPVLNFLNTSSDFKLIGKYVNTYSGGEIFLYSKSK